MTVNCAFRDDTLKHVCAHTVWLARCALGSGCDAVWVGGPMHCS